MTTGEVAAAARTDPAAAADVASLRADEQAWDRFVASAPMGSFPQLAAWAESNAAKGWTARRIVASGPDGPVGAQVLLHRMRPGPFVRGYATRGPVAAHLDRPTLAAFTGALRAGRRAGCD